MRDCSNNMTENDFLDTLQKMGVDNGCIFVVEPQLLALTGYSRTSCKSRRYW